jgi:hypothetical protein
MSGPAVIPAVAGTAVLGLRIARGQGLAATGFAVGLYIAIAAACLIVGALARWSAARHDSQ